MTVGELFCGIGGIGLGAARAGFHVQWGADLDPYVCAVYHKNFPSAEILERDITTWNPEARHQVDVLAGGFPCQPVSVAGRRKAQADARWLWPTFARIAGVLRPRFIVIENVPGLRSRKHNAMGKVLQDLAALGYDAEWTSLRASDVGAWHKRERVWIVAYPAGGGREAGAIFPSETPADGGHHLDGLSAPSAGEMDWPAEPDVVRMVYGVPRWRNRITCLGNAVVPQCAEVIFRAIAAASGAGGTTP